MMNFAEIVEKEKDVLFEILSKIISFPSINPPGNEGDAQKWVAGKFQEFGLDCDMFEVFPGRPDVVGFLKGTGKGRSLILNGHIDVVPARLLEEWSSDPFEAVFKDERVYGRGVTDMKGALACFLFIGFLLKKYNIRLSGDLLIQSVVGEEQGEPGTQVCLDRGYRADFAIVGESSEAKQVLAGVGILRGSIEVKSPYTLHFGARRLVIQTGGGQEGANAIEKMSTRIIPCLLDLERHWAVMKSHPLLIPGMGLINIFNIKAEGHPAIMPHTCSIEFVVTQYPEELEEDLKHEIEDTVRRVCEADMWLRKYPAQIEWLKGSHSFRFFPHSYDTESEPVRLLAKSYKSITGEDVVFGGRGGMTDAGVLVRGGVPAVVYGPGKIHQSHRVNEWVWVKDLVIYSKTILDFVVNWCGSSMPPITK
jgi:acetylornithine deacetylase/succinyl-diaminopimelate desuccinylase family protein